MYKVVKHKRSGGGEGRRERNGCKWWCRRRNGTLTLLTRASRGGGRRDFDSGHRTRGGRSSADAKVHPERLLRRRRIYKKLR